MTSQTHHQWRIILLSFLLFLQTQSFGLNTDGLFLLAFKYSVKSDPLNVLQNWNHHNDTPCSWNGVTCGSNETITRVTSLSLPNSGLSGSIPSTLGKIQHLKYLNLSGNSINGSIPVNLFNSPVLQILDFSNNLISGKLPELVGKLSSLGVLDLSDNAITGNLPANLTRLRNVTFVSLKNNYFSGVLPGGFDSVRVLDLSSNLINGSLPEDFGGESIEYLNVSFNRFSGEISPEFAAKIPANATVDLSFNNLTGPIPQSNVFFNQGKDSFAGNSELCGKPLENLCLIPSSAATLPEGESPPAIAAIPKIPAAASHGGTSPKRTGLRTGTILAIVVGDLVGIGVVAVIFLYVYHLKKRKLSTIDIKKEAESAKEFDWASSSSEEENNCLKKLTCSKRQPRTSVIETSSESANSSDSEEPEEKLPEAKKGEFVTFDGEKDLEIESLLKASAYILGASGSSIMYKAVLEDGSVLAVRRIGESGVDRFRDFQNQVRVVAKLVHPNLVRIRGFYWGADEKLVIYEFVPNGSLANARYRKADSSPSHLPWETRLKIARGVARGLCFIHEKKHVHGNLKPNNILLGPDMEPKIGDFGLERLVAGGDNSSKAGGSARNFGSKRSTASRDSFQDFATGTTPSPSPSVMGVSPYHAPESLRNLKPSAKWDVFSYGVVLLVLLTGKIIGPDESGLGLFVTASYTSVEEEKGRVLKMADVAIRADVEGREDALLALLKLGESCIAPNPQKRPSMKEVLQGLEKFPSGSFSSSYYYGHK